jgi:23S rRNA pseudouridine2605 synthase
MHPMQKASPGQRPRRGRHQEQPAERAGPMRIAKALARAGLCSRREAERWIELGRVSVNGLVLETPARDVSPSDRILVDGKELPSLEPPRLWRYHKPRGLVTTHSDPQGRKTVFDSLPPNMPRVISIGRLDFNTEGLLLLTNDGALARHLELPATGWLRRYRVRAHGTITQETLDGLKRGIEIAGTRYGPIEAALDKVQGANVWLTIGLREGKNREVRTVLDKLGLTVNRLIRISFGPFQLLDLEPGAVEPVRRRNLIDQLGPKVSAELALTDDEDAPGRANWAKPKAAAKAPSKSPGRAPTKAPTKAKAGS